LATNSQIEQQISGIQKIAGADIDVEKKLDELIAVLQSGNIDSEKLKQYQKKFNDAVEQCSLAAFKQLDNGALSREEMLNNLGALLQQHPVNSKMTAKLVKKSTSKRIVLGLIGLIMVTLGFAMIVMPAPPYFEMFTIFYFNNDDGVTLMDLISLLIILCGIYLLVTSAIKHKKGI